MVKKLVRFEFLVIWLISIYVYFSSGFSIWLFLILLFTPDISIVFYKINDRVGGIAYNIIHTYSIPVMLLFISKIFLNDNTLRSLCIIWISHISMDRFLGYGLKYDNFKETHIQRI